MLSSDMHVDDYAEADQREADHEEPAAADVDDDMVPGLEALVG